MKLCKDCKHFHEVRGDTPECRHPNVMSTDLVYGIRYGRHARKMRETGDVFTTFADDVQDQYCGPSGILWEKKDA